MIVDQLISQSLIQLHLCPLLIFLQLILHHCSTNQGVVGQNQNQSTQNHRGVNIERDITHCIMVKILDVLWKPITFIPLQVNQD